MNILKKICSYALVLSMVLALAACGKQQEESKESTPASQEKTQESQTGTQESKPAEREHVELNLYTYGGTYGGNEATFKLVSEYIKEKLNTSVNIHMYTAAEYDSTVGTMVASGADDMDILLTQTTRLNLDKYSDMNAFLPLEDYRDEYLSGTETLVPASYWDANSRDGHLYVVPLPRDSGTLYNIQTNVTMMEDLGVSFPEVYRNYFDLEDFLYEVKAARDKKYPEKANQPIIKSISTKLEGYFSVDPLIANLIYTNIPGVLGVEGMGEGETAYCMFMTEGYREYCKMLARLVKDGIVAYDTKSFDTDNVLWKEGELLAQFSVGTLFVKEDAGKYKLKLNKAQESVLTNAGFTSGFALSNKCKYPERALEVIELLNTDEYLATVIRFGPEGEDGGWTDKDNNGVIEYGKLNEDAKNKYNHQWYAWQLGGLTVTKVPPSVPADFTKNLNELNNNATPSSNLGFTLNTDPIINEITACNNVVKEYHTGILTLGQNENVDELCDKFVQKLKDNGIDKILKEVQNQLDAWRAVNVK